MLRRRDRGVPSSPFLRENAEVVGGEGVCTWAEDGAVVCDEVDGTRRFRAGVENPDVSDPSEISG